MSGAVRTVIFTGTRAEMIDPVPVFLELVRERDAARQADMRLFVAVGDCPTGVDAAVWRWCRTNLLPQDWTRYRADWETLGRAAGPLRNKAMVTAHPAAAMCVAMPRRGPRKHSRGTWNCHDLAAKAGIRTRVVYLDAPAAALGARR